MSSLQSLTPELTQAVAARLPKEDLRSARLACRALDAASRSLATTSTVTLTREKLLLLGGGAVRWSRFPMVQTLNLIEGRYRPATFDRGAEAVAPASLDSLFSGQQLPATTALTCDFFRGFEAGTISVLASALPSLKDVTLIKSSPEIVCALAAGAPHLQSLHAPRLNIDDASAECLRRLKNLTSLDLRSVATLDQWEALPLGQLTALSVTSTTPDGASFDRFAGMVELWTGRLAGLMDFERLALVAPNLRVLSIAFKDEIGSQPVPACVFPNVTHFCLRESRTENLPPDFNLAKLFPVLESLSICPGKDLVYPSLTGLTKLKSLALAHFDEFQEIEEHDWAAIAALTTLTAFACHLSCDEIEELVPLTSLEVLEVSISVDLESRGPADVSEIFEAVASLHRLRTLSIHGHILGGVLSFDTHALADFVDEAEPASLTTLEIHGALTLTVGQVPVLCLHPGLRRLVVPTEDDRIGEMGVLIGMLTRGRELEVWFEEFVEPDFAMSGYFPKFTTVWSPWRWH
jgi:hypothetical protein